MNNLMEIILLAIVQGVAEFLPISSSGHLAVLGRLLDFNPESGVQINIILHAGTLMAIVIFYFKELIGLLKPEQRQVVVAIIVGTVPAGIVGILLKQSGLDEIIFSNLFVPGIGFLITDTLLLFGIRGQKNDTEIKRISIKQSLLIGLAQAIAIMPGISRSGSTIATGLKMGLKKADAARFSFLLAIPAIGGAALVELLSALKKQNLAVDSSELTGLAIGFAISMAVGYVSLCLLLKMLSKGKLDLFAWYLYAVGAAVLIWATVSLFI